MKCSNCGLPVSKDDKVCSHCGKSPKSSAKFLVLTSLILISIFGVLLAAFWFKDELPNITEKTTKQDPVSVIDKDKDHNKETGKEPDKESNKESNKESDKDTDKDVKPDKKTDEDKNETKENKKNQIKTEYIVGENAVAKDEPKIEKKQMNIKEKEDLTSYIDSAKKSVFTVSTPEMQGSGFLYDWNGAIVTNAHVVEGWTEAMVRTNDGQEFTGKVIGYSNKTDVAVVHVPELKGKKPFAVNKTGSFDIGEEIVALGSPNGQENSATMGFITGKNRSFNIGSFVYDHLYQISAPIASGSSGGPLVSKNKKEIIAINSAQSTTDLSIGFSIPISQVSQLIQSWIDSPMTDHELLKQFYGEDGDFVIGEEWDKEEGFFEEGDISEDEEHYDYWEYEYDEYNKDKDKEKDTNKQKDQATDEIEKEKVDESNQDKEKQDKPKQSDPEQTETTPNSDSKEQDTESKIKNEEKPETVPTNEPTETPTNDANDTAA